MFITGFNLVDDVLASSNDPTDIINGLSGNDTVSYALSTAVNVALSIAGPQSTGGSGIELIP